MGETVDVLLIVLICLGVEPQILPVFKPQIISAFF